MRNSERSSKPSLHLVVRPLLSAFVAGTLAACSAGAPPSADGQAAPKSFRSPEAAAKALVEVAGKGDRAALVALFGSGAEDLLSSGDEVADRRAGEEFAAAAAEKSSVEKVDEGHAVLVFGKDDRPFPIPLVKNGRSWTFDAAAGREELLNRRIGRNEIHAIGACLGYVDAQRDYAARQKSARGKLEYAQRVNSTPGRRDGLYWDVREGERESPLGPFFAAAAAEGYDLASGEHAGEAWHGYRFRVLTGQGPDAPGGRRSYLRKGRMTEGFALVAWPAVHGNSGVMTFVVNQVGVVFQKDLGEKTSDIASAMTEFNPDDSWDPVEPIDVVDDDPDDSDE